jgi:hypothetical protein
MRLAVTLALLALLAAAALPAAAQCAMCKTVLEGSPEGRSLAGGLNNAILLMIAAPYVIFGVFIAVAFRKRWPAWLQRFPASLRGAARPPSSR